MCACVYVSVCGVSVCLCVCGWVGAAVEARKTKDGLHLLVKAQGMLPDL